jgi:lysozyme family protein
MAKFESAIAKTLAHEGVKIDRNGNPVPGGRTGWSDRKTDTGGKTNYGITIGVARANGYRGDMRRIPFDLVMRIYRKRYWDILRCSEIPHQAIAEEMFDTCVNCGRGYAGRFLQRALNKLNNRGRRWLDLVVDGKVGPMTIRTLKTALRSKRYMGSCILKILDSQQCVRYMKICDKNEMQEANFPGWVRARCGVKT